MDYTIKQEDTILVGDAEIEEKGLVHHHITSANDLYEIGVPQIITQGFEVNLRLDDIKRDTDDDKVIDHVEIKVTFSDVVISKPTLLNYNSGKEEVIFPNTARIKEKTYKATLHINVKVVATAFMKSGATVSREDDVKDFKICKMPIIVGSKWCNTYGLTKETLERLHEDPSDPGGYFIIKGIEWVVDCVENILFNKVRIFRNAGYKKEVMRAEFISKPGDFYLNSDQFIIRWLTDGQLTIEFRREKLKDLHIPFYLIFRIMGWATDKLIFDNLLYDYNTRTSKNMIQELTRAFNANYNHLNKGRDYPTQKDALEYIAAEIAESGFAYLDVRTYPENTQKITNFILDNLDIHFLQHMGTTMQSRDRKLRFLCVLIRKMFLTNMNNIEPTDRDSYNSKRIAAAGVSCAKIFKTHFNATIIQQVKRRLTKDFKTMSFFKIELGPTIRASVYGSDFERALTQAITAGNKAEIKVSQKVRTNRMSSQLLNRKNQLNTYATLRQVTATSSDSAKQSERANEMRRVHLSFLGYICTIHSPEGEKVGINKQLAIFSFITKASFSEVIKDMLLDDNEIFALNTIDYLDIAHRNLCNIYVNGDWIGCCNDALYIAKKYRQKRREFAINPEITIVWDNTQNEVYFWTDAGRVIRPLMIVYNTKRDPEMCKKFGVKSNVFLQGLALTQKHITDLYAGTMKSEDLLKENIIEYISAEEQENMLLAPSYEHLKKDKNNILVQYTHCDIPQAMLGLTALTSPFATHNQAQRIVYQTSQSKQTCGVFAKNWTYRADKDTFLQYNNEMPIVKTLSNRYLFPNGTNCIVAMMCNSGYNQEDSLIMNKGAVDRGLFNGCKLTFYKTELEQHEEFANPDITNTIDIKSACFDKLTNGIIKKGVIVNKNDAIIGKILKITKNANDDFQYMDRSIIYKDEETAIVHNVIVDRNEDDERFCKVMLRKLRPVSIGDKFCFTPGHEVLTLNGWKRIEYIDIKTDKVATLNKSDEVEWRYPEEQHAFNHDGDIYHLESETLEYMITLNHKVYCSTSSESEGHSLIEAQDIIGKEVYYKKNGHNIKPDIPIFTVGGDNLPSFDISIDMDSWFVLFGNYIRNGYVDLRNKIHINLNDDSGDVICVLARYGISFTLLYKNHIIILNDRVSDSLRIYEKEITTLCLVFGRNQSNTLLNALIPYNTEYSTNSKRMIDTLQILYFNAERKSEILFDENTRLYTIREDQRVGVKDSYKKEEIIDYKGRVYCLTVPNNVMLVRFNNKYAWSGNSSRSGQKGTIGLLLDEADMPRTKDGIAPDILMNPHSIPSRMTIGQLKESHIGRLCSELCTQIDATIFKKIDIETVALKLSDLGINKYGYERLFNGVTGEWIDCLIFYGVVNYQRLQKFTADTQYAIGSGASDAITHQPLDGKSSGGGLRLGEMERDVIASHSAMKFMTEKFFNHSDGYTNYVCRCGKAATVNIKHGIYKCEYCKDNADIVAYNTSWSSKLFIQEMESMNVGIKQKPNPFTYGKVDPNIFNMPKITNQ